MILAGTECTAPDPNGHPIALPPSLPLVLLAHPMFHPSHLSFACPVLHSDVAVAEAVMPSRYRHALLLSVPLLSPPPPLSPPPWTPNVPPLSLCLCVPHAPPFAALAEAATPYGIESFDDVLEPLWRGIRSLRGKVLAAFLKAIGHIIPLMDAEHAFYYTREVSEGALPVLWRPLQWPHHLVDGCRAHILLLHEKVASCVCCVS